VQAFVEILTSGAPMMATVLRHLLYSNPPQALFMHCTTGNNRTGVFIALLLLLLNVPPTYVIEDYTLSEIGLAPTKHVNVERLLKKGAFSEFGEVEARRKCERMVGARRESMEGLLEEVERRWKGAEGYFLEVVRLSADEVQAIKHILTTDGEGNLSIQFTK
jgi:protein tyrosine/serine phosphatase